MVVVAMVTDLTTHMVTTPLVNHSGVDPNHRHITNLIILTGINHMLLGDLVVMDLETLTVAQEVVKVLLWSRNSSDKY